MLKSSMTLPITIHQQDLTILTKCVSLGSVKPGLTIMQYTHITLISAWTQLTDWRPPPPPPSPHRNIKLLSTM